VLSGFSILETTSEASALARGIVDRGAMSAKAGADALHIAIAAHQGLDYLLTWNCKHLANATICRQITAIRAAAGLVVPVICTPDELSEE
jgi:hypothetical protein